MAVSGATLTVAQGSSRTTTTDAAGWFELGGLPAGLLSVDISAPGYHSYRTKVTLTGSQAGARFELLPQSAPFDLAFYRQFARRALESPLLATRPWTVDPAFYLQSVTADTGRVVETDVLEAIARLVMRSVPELSGGLRAVRSVEWGPEYRVGPGLVSVRFYEGLIDNSPYGGDATVGGNQGFVRIRHNPSLNSSPAAAGRGCGSFAESIMDHEIVHVMGFYHTDVIYLDFDSPECTGSGRRDRVRYHAAAMYSRPPGNVDIDNDAGAFSRLWASGSDTQPRVACTLEHLTGER